MWLFSRGGSKAKPELSLSLRDVVRPETSPGYLPFIICSIFISSFIASDISRMMDAGSSANASIVLGRAEEVVVVDERALRFDGDRVYVLAENGEERTVQVGLSDGLRIQITDGVGHGDRIVLPN